MSFDAYKFVRLTAADFPLLMTWLSDPEVRRWWGDPDQELAEITRDMDNPHISMNLVWFKNKPFAFIQDYDVHAWPEKHRLSLPKGARSIDVLIGEPQMRGIGHGVNFLVLRARQLSLSGCRVVIDPLQANMNARKAYKKAGFVGDEATESDEGPIILMTFNGS